MNRNLIAVGVVYLLLALAITPAVGTHQTKGNLSLEVATVTQTFKNGNILYVGGSGPNNYTKIQDAIDNASDGDTIMVYPGAYKENIVVHKSLTIRGAKKNEKPVIEPENENRSVVYIIAEKCRIENFVIRGRIYVISYGHSIINNIFEGDGGGITSPNTVEDTIAHNIFRGNGYSGIDLDDSYIMKIYNNTFSGDYYTGIYLSDCGNLNIFNNTFHSMSKGIFGGSVYELKIYSNEFYNLKEDGIHISPSASYNEIFQNKIFECKCGISFAGRGDNIFHNEIYNNSLGIWINGGGVRVFENNITNNKVGINLYNVYPFYGGATLIFHNNFIANEKQATFVDAYLNIWFNNYWSDWHVPLLKIIFGTRCTLLLICYPWIQFDLMPSLKPIEWWRK